MPKTRNEKPYVIVRTYSAGVFAGTLEFRDNREVVLTGVRRLWRWEGAATLSQLAMEGVKHPGKCMFPCEVAEIRLFEVIEILHVTDCARASIARVPVWSA